MDSKKISGIRGPKNLQDRKAVGQNEHRGYGTQSVLQWRRWVVAQSPKWGMPASVG